MAGKHIVSGYPSSTFEARNSAKESFEKISDIGTTQHFVVVDRDIRKKLTKFPFISDFNNYSVKHLVVFFIAHRYRENQVRARDIRFWDLSPDIRIIVCTKNSLLKS